MKTLMTYSADKGSVVINSIYFSNGIGDGEFNVVFADTHPNNIKAVAQIDLRQTPLVEIWGYDCEPTTEKIFTYADFDNAQVIEFGIDGDGNLIIWKLF